MQQKSQVDTQFLQGLEMLIDSISKSEDVIIKDDVDHWCPDAQAWHTADHQPTDPPQVHINVADNGGDDPYKTENASMDQAQKEYDQNTNLPDVDRKEGESVAEPFLRRHSFPEDLKKSYEQPLDMLKIWASVDRALIKDDELNILDDLSILNSFELDTKLSADDLVDGTIVHKMLVERSSRPTKEWWKAGMDIAKSMDGVDEPAFLAAYLYYSPEDFDISDFISLQKAEPSNKTTTRGKPQDLEMMPNSSGGDGMAGLGLSADNEQHPGPDDEDCD